MTSDTQRSELVDDVDRTMIERGDRIGAGLQRALLKFYDEHSTPPKVASGELDAAKAKVIEFARAILHGDDEHRGWLMGAALAFNAGDELPPPRGKGIATPVDHPEVVGVTRWKLTAQHDISGNTWIDRIVDPAGDYITYDDHLAALRPSDSPALEAGVAEADLFWDDENPEESYRDVEDIFDAIGEHATYMKVRRAKSLPDVWVSGVVGEDDGDWQITYHKNADEARETVQAALAALSIPAKEDGK